MELGKGAGKGSGVRNWERSWERSWGRSWDSSWERKNRSQDNSQHRRDSWSAEQCGNPAGAVPKALRAFSKLSAGLRQLFPHWDRQTVPFPAEKLPKKRGFSQQTPNAFTMETRAGAGIAAGIRPWLQLPDRESFLELGKCQPGSLGRVAGIIPH